jgi:probable addiction module antidote protein
MMDAKFSRFDVADFLETEEDVAHFLTDAFDTGDAAYVAHCLGVVARAKGMSRLSRETGITREQLYSSFSEGGNPTLRSFFSLMKALNAKLTVRLGI